MNQQRPLSHRNAVQLLVILTILAWATTLLLHQWGFGQEVLTVTPDMLSDQKFIPSDSSTATGGTLELQGEATVDGADVNLKQICRWSDADASLFSPLANLTIIHLTAGQSTRSISVDEIRQTLHDAGVNVAMINFAGKAQCAITRADAPVTQQDAVGQWAAAQASAAVPAALSVAAATPTPTAVPDPAIHALRDLLTQDICQRLGISADAIQMDFSPEDDKILALAEPVFKFDIRPSRARNLGMVSWDVTVIAPDSNRRVSITARARAWEDHVVVSKPLAYKQILQTSDFTTQRMLVESLPDQMLLRLDQCVGQQAAMELKPGALMTARLVDPVPLVRAGQLVTITLTDGTVQIRSVGRAMEEGSLGQIIKVRNETTHDLFDIVVTGQQEGRLSGSSPI